MSNNEQLSFEQILALYESFKGNEQNVELSSNELIFNFQDPQKKDILEKEFKKAGLVTSSFSNKSFSIDSSFQNFVFFDNLDSLFDRLSLSPTIIQTFDIFVFDESGHYFYNNSSTQNVESNLPYSHKKFLLKHFSQYTTLLKIFLEHKGRLVEVEKNTSKGKELIILSKGEEKLITSINYLNIDKDVFQLSYSEFPLERFSSKLIIDEWLACFKNTLCQFMELQSDDRRSFGNLYTNFNYIYNQTSKNYDLYLSKFSFDKIRKQFRAEKNNYFEGLNNAQDKISSQIISIPLSLGASIYSFFQLDAHSTTLKLVFFAVCIYTLFIIYVLAMNLYDIKKIASDAHEEKMNMKNYFPDLLKDYKSDFKFMKNKMRRVAVLGWGIIIALLLTLVFIAIFIFEFQDIEKSIFFFALN